ncbi:MAG: L,D-transpeptidase family protein [Clostridiales bacterium]|nr:L,D-transpeptidase family protein [Clostridiales bacterium]
MKLLRKWRSFLAVLVIAVAAVTGFVLASAETVYAAEAAESGTESGTEALIDISSCTVTLSKTSYTYNGAARKPGVTVTVNVDGKTVKLKKNTDYTVTYKNNKNVGTAKVVIKGTGSYTGKTTVTFKIKAKSISKAKVTLSKTKYTYNGSAKKPSATVKLTLNGSTVTLKKNTDYTVSYSSNTKVGTATVTIKGKGNYSGTVKKTFKIVPTKVTIKSISMSGKKITLTWKKVTGATGYRIYRKTKGGEWERIKTVTSASTLTYSDSNVEAGTKYYYRIRAYYKKDSDSKAMWGAYSTYKALTCKPAEVTLKSAVLVSGTSAKVTWEAQSTADGYYVYRKSGDSWKKIATVTDDNSYTDTGLTYGKTYTYTVRAYWKSGDDIIKGYYDSDGIKVKVTYTSKYVDGYKLYYDADGNLITDVTDIIGEQSSYEIKVNKQSNTVTVYAKDGDNGYTIPVKAFICSCGNDTPLGTYYTPEKYRWHTLQHDVEGQWCTRITTGILFHSVWYYSRDNTTLSVTQYNKLGTTASAGCVRLTAEDAKWIYDNCALGTKVTIYNSSNPGPLGKPTAQKLESWHTWDPTDPTAQDLCEKYGCH